MKKSVRNEILYVNQQHDTSTPNLVLEWCSKHNLRTMQWRLGRSKPFLWLCNKVRRALEVQQQRCHGVYPMDSEANLEAQSMARTGSSNAQHEDRLHADLADPPPSTKASPPPVQSDRWSSHHRGARPGADACTLRAKLPRRSTRCTS